MILDLFQISIAEVVLSAVVSAMSSQLEAYVTCLTVMKNLSIFFGMMV